MNPSTLKDSASRPARSLAAAAAFTLIELLVVMMIIGLLASLLLPAVSTMTDRANNLKCISNLRQLGAAAHASANDNDNRFPAIEVDKDNPIYPPEDNAKPLPEALERYGVTAVSLQCPADMKRGLGSTFLERGSSYMWLPYSEDEPTAAITVYSRRGSYVTKQSRVRLATDWEAIHPAESAGGPMRMNAVYADGHVTTMNQARPQPR